MNEQAKSDLLKKLPYGLYILTADAGSERGGMLVSWVMQASFAPPLLAVAVQAEAHTTAIMQKSGAFALNFLADEQRKLAGAFGQEYAKVGDKLARQSHYPGPATGSPILEDLLGYVECRITGWMAGGDHVIAVGEIVSAAIADDALLMTTISSGMSYSG